MHYRRQAAHHMQKALFEIDAEIRWEESLHQELLSKITAKEL
jgi:hypothetical protein